MLASKACPDCSKSVPLQRISNPTGVQYLIIHFKITTTMEEEKKLSRPSMEVLNEYDKLEKKFLERGMTDEQLNEVMEKLNAIVDAYDLTNYVFEDPATGKKGVKDPAGQILVPAEYDDFNFVGDRIAFQVSHMAAKRDGKYGIVAADGTLRLPLRPADVVPLCRTLHSMVGRRREPFRLGQPQRRSGRSERDGEIL